MHLDVSVPNAGPAEDSIVFSKGAPREVRIRNYSLHSSLLEPM